MVSAAKLRRAQEAMFAARPYARKMVEVLQQPGHPRRPTAHPLLQERGDERDPRWWWSPRTRACAAASTPTSSAPPSASSTENAAQDAEPGAWWAARAATSSGAATCRCAPSTWASSRPCSYATAQTDRPASSSRTSRRGRWTRSSSLYNEFKSVIQQRIVVEQLLPIERGDHRRRRSPPSTTSTSRARGRSSQAILPKHVEIQVWRALLESAAAEHGARMAAMDAATNNAGGDDRAPHPLHEQGAPGRHHQGDHRGGVGRGAAPGLSRSRRSMATENVGRVVQIIGPVVDVEFDEERARHLQRRAHPGRRAEGGVEAST